MSDDLAKEFEAIGNNLKSAIAKGNDVIDEEFVDQKQQTFDWFMKKLGKFSGSKLPKLMTGGRGKAEWGDTAYGVLMEIALERDLTDEGKQSYIEAKMAEDFRATRWGNANEEQARIEYEQESGETVELTWFEETDLLPNFGASTDGKCAGKKKIIEIKCPYNVVNHQKNVALDEINEKHTYFWQMQGNMLVTGADECDFISFDPRRKSHRLKIINLKRDEEACAKLIHRLKVSEKAVDYMLRLELTAEDSVLLSEKDIRDGK